MGKSKKARMIFQSKVFIFSLIFSFILLISAEAVPSKVAVDSNDGFKPVVRVKEGQEEVPPGQKERFERLIEEGKRLFLEEMDYEGAIKKFKEAEGLAVTRFQKADANFYLSLAYYDNLEEMETEFDEAIRKLIELNYYRELDKLLCPPKYIELYEGIKKEYGVVRVQSKPAGADVYINDSLESAGKTPLTTGCRAGSVKIRVKRGKKQKEEILRVIAGKETASSVLALKGGASMLLVLGGIALAGGAAAALLSKGGGGDGGEAPGTTTGSIQVNSTPQGARVFLDGNNTGQTTNCTLTNVSPGNHTVMLDKEGYRDYQESVSVSAGQTTTVSANLNEFTINVTGPTSSTVWKRGEEVEIRWGANGSIRLQRNPNTDTALNPSLRSGRNLFPSLRGRNLQNRLSFRNSIRTRKEVESIASSKNRGIPSAKSIKVQSISKKLYSSKRQDNIFSQKAKKIIIQKSSLKRINLPIARSVSRGMSVAKKNIKILGLTNVKIDLYKGTTLNMQIVSSTENDGSYNWTVNTTLEEGTDYKIRISCATNSSIYGESDAFKIAEKAITVTEPTSSTVWTTDEPADITWTSQGTINNVKIDLYKGTTFKQTIASSTTNDGSYTWPNVDSTLENGVDYEVRIEDTGDSSVYDESDAFKISDTTITVIEPSSSTAWITGDPGDITWTSKGTINNVKIDLYKGTTFKTTITTSTINDGSYTWPVVDTTLDDATDYKIRVSDDADSSIYDESNRFQIAHSYVFVLKWGTEGIEDGQFQAPSKIAIDSSGYIYVVDHWNHRIQKFTSDGTFVSKWGGPGSGDGQFDRPEGIAIDSSGYVYVVDGENDRIQKFTSDGTFVDKWGSHGAGDGQFDWPHGIAIDSSDNVYVTDQNNERIQKFTSDGTFITKWGSYGTGDGQFKYPRGIAIDSSDYVYVTDPDLQYENDRIQKFTSNGTFVTKWGNYGAGDGQFHDPYGIDVDSSGYVYVADSQNHRVQKFTSNGTFVTKWGTYGTADFNFIYPYGLAVDSSGNVYVADTSNHCIKKFSPASSGGGLQFNQTNHNILDNNISINKSSQQKSYNSKSSLQNKLKQMMQIKRKDKHSEKRK